MPDFDSFVLGLPVIGARYEGMRKETYFRHDTRLMYQTVVTDVVDKRINELVAANGVKLIRSPRNVAIDFDKKTATTPA